MQVKDGKKVDLAGFSCKFSGVGGGEVSVGRPLV